MSTLNADDRRQLGESVERFADQDYDFDKRKLVLASAEGYSKLAWSALAELGLVGLGVPEAAGGVGGSIIDLGVIMRAIGRRLLMEPFLSTAVTAAPLVAALDPEGAAFDLSAAIAGEQILTLAHYEPQLGFARGPIATQATSSGTGYTLTGHKSFVLDAPIADVLLITALDPHGQLGVFLVDAADAKPGMKPFRSVDQRWAADLDLQSVKAIRLGKGGAEDLIDAALDRTTIALGFEAVASMELLINETAAYLKNRRAFGKTLSQFQVLQHRIVDMFVYAKEAEAITEAAALALDAGTADRGALAAVAKLHVCRAARFVAENAVQLHGGIAMTDELAVSHHFKRLMMAEALFGDGEHHLERYIGLTADARALSA